MDVALAKKVSVDLVKVHLMQIPDIQQLVEEIWKSTGVMDSERTLCDHHYQNQGQECSDRRILREFRSGRRCLSTCSQKVYRPGRARGSTVSN